ncbi:MAG: glycosyltransferase [Lachnospiraceae bacterium]|nr:glycosyltransferase [Lachnospiraceae bacterium]
MRQYSVLMSVYIKENAIYFEKSIESMLKQSISPTDFVIVCDGPLTEELNKVIEEKRKENPELFQIIRIEKCGGLGNALAKGIQYCKNDLVARMDSDDISAKERCEKQLQIFEMEDVEIVGSNILEFEGDISNTKFERCVPKTDTEIKKFARRRNPFNHPSVMLKKAAVLSAGNYQDYKGFEDYFLWIRMLNQGMKGYNIQENLLYMRTDAGMYGRRGGFDYACRALKMRWKIYKTGYSSLEDFFVSGLGQLIVAVVPLRLRKGLYEKILRKRRKL